MQLRNILLLMILLGSSPGLAQDWFDEPKRKEGPLPEDKSLVTYAPSVRTLVPHGSELHGYTLRVDGIPYPIKNFIDLPGVYQEEEVDVEVVSDDGRILDYQYRTIDAELMRDLKIRKFQFKLGGGYRKTDDEKWNDFGIKPSGSFINFSGSYFANGWGMSIGLQRIRRSGKDKTDRLVEYEVTENPILIGYDFVPFADSPEWRAWQLRLWAGFVRGQHSFKTHVDKTESDGSGNTIVSDASIKANASTTGLLLGLEWMRPVTDRVWFSFEYSMLHRSLKFKEISFFSEKPIHDFKIGMTFSI